MVIRENYLKKIRPFYNQDLIKVITGIRRCGKSVILKQIINEIIESGVKEENIIYVNFELSDYFDIKEAKELDKYIKERIVNKKKYYLFFDEIQSVNEWEKVINSYKAKYENNISIFITGSNSDLLSGELATFLSGRYVSFKIHPFSFKEVCEFKKEEFNKYQLEEQFNDYVKWGGMPQRFQFNQEEEIRTYLTDVYDSIVVKDIINRFRITDIELFNRVAEYIVTTPSQTFSADSLSKYFETADGRSVSKTTLYNYLEYMCKALFINKVDRYDVRGKRILNGKYKYYLTDLGLGQILSVSKREQMGAYLENIVYNELVYRGYDVKVGNLDSSEIDFIALKDGKKEYYQVCYYLTDDSVIKREFGAFDTIDDNYPKYVISMDKFDMSQNGIININIIDWLLNEKA